MTIRVRRLVCDIVVSLPMAVESRSPEATQATVHFQRAIPQDETTTASRAAADPSAEPTGTDVVGAAESPGVDPRLLADRVFRLMKEDVAIARERA